ncbi:hypothetical protein F383_04542 [Gossypium arboreum]|uniref:Uncharacterized protein n=1 Tax=Gossypium arboreum TaxID=29729 RepID=A0A0B0PTD8_GOSAR|nr:hypothetical protein F383_04542 [Gossypium arboreum]
MLLSQTGSYTNQIQSNHKSIPLSETGFYSHTYIGITYRCHGLTRTHISESYVMTYVS